MDQVTRIEIDAVFALVKAGIGYEARVSRILRTITEAIQFDRFCGSTAGKQINRIVSREAANLLATMTRREFAKATVLEHSKPINLLYVELLAKRECLTRDELSSFLIEQVQLFPLVTITKAEDRRLDNTLVPHERYRIAQIEVGTVHKLTFRSEPEWVILPHAFEIIVEN